MIKNTEHTSTIRLFRLVLYYLTVMAAVLCLTSGVAMAKAAAADSAHQAKADRVREQMEQRTSNQERKAAAASLKEFRLRIHEYAIQKYGFDPREKAWNDRRQQGQDKGRTKGNSPQGTLGVVGVDFQPIPLGPFTNGQPSLPDYNTTANWAYTPPIAKFVDTLSTLDCANPNNLGQCVPIAAPDTVTYPGTDYYEISLEQWYEVMHSDMPLGTPTRGYVQTNEGTAGITINADGSVTNPTNCDAPDPLNPSANSCNTVTPPGQHFLGPIIVAQKDRPVRIKFTNKLAIGAGGDLFIPVDQSVMGAGTGPLDATGNECINTAEGNTCEFYTQNRATIHLHGGRTPWISDGTPHQWITPANEDTPYPQGVSVAHVPDMPTPTPGDGSMTFYYSNQQTARLMFYHDHAFGITRLNVMAGMAAGYLIQDEYEHDLIARNVIPAEQIPLVIQDRTFVDATPVTHPLTNLTVPRIRVYDPLWNWGTGTFSAVTGEREPRTGDLWLPHVYVPAQNPFNPDKSGVNPYGRWLYGPWFYPPTVITHPPVANPYYDLDCDSTNPWILADCGAPGQPPLIPAIPHPSMGMEAFLDSMIVNGTAFPRLEVEPRAYRFRILNAANDRGLNLSIYKADATPGNVSPVSAGGQLPFSNNPVPPGFNNRTEVAMVPAQPTAGWPELWPIDGREGGVPDPGTQLPNGRYSNWGPSWIQIGTDAGFLPAPVVRDPQPITYVTDPTAFWVGVVQDTALGLMPAERADVIVDFSEYAGQTLIVYNDAPTAWPALDFRYDYWTGTPDFRDSGGYGAGGTYNVITGVWEGGHGILPGFAPNTRTVMQIVVKASNSSTAPAFDPAKLAAEFTTAAVPTLLNPAGRPLFERAMEPIIVAQPAYDEAYGTSFPTSFPWGGVRYSLDDGHIFKFQTIAGEKASVLMKPKGIHDEMGASFDPEFGRMSGNLAIERQPPLTNNANLHLYGFSDVPTELVANSTTTNVQVDMLEQLQDGTQIWNISHNGVDTHPIHFHIFDVQLISRLGWDGQIKLPLPNELGWKDTVRISPLMDTVVAVRPVAPEIPFGIPNSLRPLNPAIPIGDPMGFNNTDPVTGQAYAPPSPWAGGITNRLYDFGWEYVWHCHILSHEEMDMMRPIILQVETMLADNFSLAYDTNISTPAIDLSWNDPTAVDIATGNYGNALTNEIGYYVWRSAAGTGAYSKVGAALANHTSFTDDTGTPGDYYVIEAYTATGSTYSDPLATVTMTVSPIPGPYAAPADLTLETVVGAPLAQSVTSVEYYEGTELTGFTLLGTGSGANYTFVWNNVQAGSYNIVAVANAEVPDPTAADLNNMANLSAVSAIQAVEVTSFAADFTVNSGLEVGVCDPITLVATTPLSGTAPFTYNWVIDGTPLATAGEIINLPAFTVGNHSVTLNVADNAGAVASTTQTVTVVAHAPTLVDAGGPYLLDPLVSTVPGLPPGTIVLVGSATVADLCVSGAPAPPAVTNSLSYAWDLDNDGNYEYFTNNRSLKYAVAMQILGSGAHTITFKVTDQNGATATATADLTINAPIDPPTTLNVPATSAGSTFTVSWTPALTAGVDEQYILEESADPTFATSTQVVLANLTDTSVLISKTFGTWYYRVKAHSLAAGAIDSVWTVAANGCTITALTPATVNELYSQQLTAVGGTGPYSWSAFGLPSGLTVSIDGLLSGTPDGINLRAGSSYATFPVSLIMVDSAGGFVSHVLMLTVNQANQAPL